MFKNEGGSQSHILQHMRPGNDSKTATSACLRKSSHGISRRWGRLSLLHHQCLLTKFRQQRKHRWSNIKLLISDRFTELLIEWALNKDNLKEWLENWDSKREDRVGTVIRFALLSLLLTLRVDEFGKRDEITTWIGFTCPFFRIHLWIRLLDFRPIYIRLEACIPRLFIVAHREFEVDEIEVLKDSRAS